MRYKDMSINTNAEADGELLYQIASPDDAGKKMLDEAYKKMGLSMRGYNRVLRVARTIADMEESNFVKMPHIAEALTYRKISLR